MTPFGLQWPFCVFLALLTSFLACLQNQYATREQQEMTGKKNSMSDMFGFAPPFQAIKGAPLLNKRPLNSPPYRNIMKTA